MDTLQKKKNKANCLLASITISTKSHGTSIWTHFLQIVLTMNPFEYEIIMTPTLRYKELKSKMRIVFKVAAL